MRPYNPAYSGLGCIPVRSPLLRESLLISFPGLLRWFTSPSVALPSYFIQTSQCMNHFIRVTPFGNPRIKGYVLLPAAFRSLSRPSSPAGSKASAMDLYSLDHITFLPPELCFTACAGHQASLPSLAELPEVFSTNFSLFPSLVISKNHSDIKSELMGQNRVELLTPALSERCSNQMSYCPKMDELTRM